MDLKITKIIKYMKELILQKKSLKILYLHVLYLM